MSTTFEAFPRTRELPSFRAVLERSTRELHGFLASIDIDHRPQIHARLQRNSDRSHVAFGLDDPLRWDEDVYAWFMVGDVPGGTDAYFRGDPAAFTKMWGREFHGPRYDGLRPVIDECLAVRHSWSFRRSAGQSCTINLAYGLIAGSLAALTDGLVHSDDRAWEWERLPARPDDFLRFYFRPELALTPEMREWSKRCLGQIEGELEAAAP